MRHDRPRSLRLAWRAALRFDVFPPLPRASLPPTRLGAKREFKRRVRLEGCVAEFKQVWIKEAFKTEGGLKALFKEGLEKLPFASKCSLLSPKLRPPLRVIH